MIRVCGSMRIIIPFSLFYCILVRLVWPCFIMGEPDINEIEHLQVINRPDYFPPITISAVNCNSLNMSTVTKHVRLRKFYGICSLKTEVIFISDLRMCNKAGQTDSKFAHETFSINP